MVDCERLAHLMACNTAELRLQHVMHGLCLDVVSAEWLCVANSFITQLTGSVVQQFTAGHAPAAQ